MLRCVNLSDSLYKAGGVIQFDFRHSDLFALPNEWRSPYIYLIPDETLTLVNTYLNPYVEDRTAEDLHLPS